MNDLMRPLRTAICFTLMASLVGCGTLIYPERRGQQGGRIDPAVAILDGIGLLLFIVPGLVAFAIDFSTGAIYLPGTAAGSGDRHTLKVVRFDPARATAADIEEILWKETGHQVKLNQANMKVSRLESPEEIRKRFAEIVAQESNIRVAFKTK